MAVFHLNTRNGDTDTLVCIELAKYFNSLEAVVKRRDSYEAGVKYVSDVLSRLNQKDANYKPLTFKQVKEGPEWAADNKPTPFQCFTFAVLRGLCSVTSPVVVAVRWSRWANHPMLRDFLADTESLVLTNEGHVYCVNTDDLDDESRTPFVIVYRFDGSSPESDKFDLDRAWHYVTDQEGQEDLAKCDILVNDTWAEGFDPRHVVAVRKPAPATNDVERVEVEGSGESKGDNPEYLTKLVRDGFTLRDPKSPQLMPATVCRTDMVEVVVEEFLPDEDRHRIIHETSAADSYAWHAPRRRVIAYRVFNQDDLESFTSDEVRVVKNLLEVCGDKMKALARINSKNTHAADKFQASLMSLQDLILKVQQLG